MGEAIGPASAACVSGAALQRTFSAAKLSVSTVTSGLAGLAVDTELLALQPWTPGFPHGQHLQHLGRRRRRRLHWRPRFHLGKRSKHPVLLTFVCIAPSTSSNTAVLDMQQPFAQPYLTLLAFPTDISLCKSAA